MSLESSMRRARSLLAIPTESRTGIWGREACRCSSDIIEDVVESWAASAKVEAEILPLVEELLQGVLGIKESGQAGCYSEEMDTFAANIEDRHGRLRAYASRQVLVLSEFL